MKKLIQLGVLAVLVYVAIQKGPALLEGVTDMGSDLGRKGSSVSQNSCVATAERASETFSREMRKYRKPPVDLDAWNLSMERVREMTYNADNQCQCNLGSCQRAREALGELNALVSDFDNSLHGGGAPHNPARQQETIDRLLKRARDLDRQGS